MKVFSELSGSGLRSQNPNNLGSVSHSSSIGQLKRQVTAESRKESHSVQPHWEEGQRSRDSQVCPQGLDMRFRVKQGAGGVHSQAVLVRVWSWPPSLTHHCQLQALLQGGLTSSQNSVRSRWETGSPLTGTGLQPFPSPA